MTRIITLTMNPSVDRNTSVERVAPERKLRCGPPRLGAGGGGINVSRAIRKLGGASLAVYVRGGPPGEMLERMLTDEGVEQHPIEAEGWTRENFAVLEMSTNAQYRFNLPGPEMNDAECWHSLEVIQELLQEEPAILVASGSLPAGTCGNFYARASRSAREVGATMIVDSAGDPLREAVAAGVDAIRVNYAEMVQLAGRPLQDDKRIESAARGLIESGKCRHVVVSLGAGGAIVVTPERARRIVSPAVPIRSRVGAGDSMLAGIALRRAQGWSFEDAVRFGVAAGTAAVMTEGSELCRREDVERLFAFMNESQAQ
jgi:6-phosphofructokinase 2